MINYRILSIVSLLALFCTPSFAAPVRTLRDVPSGFWAAKSVQSVVGKKLMHPQSGGNFNGNKPVTRYELAVVLDRLVKYMNAAHKPLSPVHAHAVKLPRRMPKLTATAFKDLIGKGYLSSKTPLLLYPGTSSVTADQLTDAISQVTIRISDLSLPPMKD